MGGVHKIPDRDESNREFIRLAITEKGWAFLAHFLEMETSVLDSLYCEDHNGVRETAHYCKFYDNQGAELTTQPEIDSSCVKSVFTIKKGVDIEIVAGEVHQYERPLSNMRMHALIGVIDPNGNPVQVTPFVRNLNMMFQDKAKSITTDGRSPKMLIKDIDGVPYDANQIQIIVNHDAGVKHKFMVELEYYRQ